MTNQTEDYLEQLRLTARRDPKLRKELLDTQESEQPLVEFCNLAQQAGFPITPGDMIRLGEDYYDTLFKSCNGAAVTPLDGWGDAYEMFLASLF
jgi:hypothetical protein